MNKSDLIIPSWSEFFEQRFFNGARFMGYMFKFNLKWSQPEILVCANDPGPMKPIMFAVAAAEWERHTRRYVMIQDALSKLDWFSSFSDLIWLSNKIWEAENRCMIISDAWEEAYFKEMNGE